jgi:Spondin_N
MRLADMSRTRNIAAAVCVLIAATACSSSTMPSVPSAADPPAAPAPAPAPTPLPPAPTTARYRAMFRATWSAVTHSIDFPGSAHFSPLVGGTHNSQVSFWREGELATLGIQDMAERGLTFRLTDEIAAAISAGTAERAFTGESIGSSPGVATVEFTASQTHPLVTLVSMVAPSPDWFVGVSGVRLFDSGRWVDDVTFELVPWDAGTDNGATFSSPDLPAVPHLPIARIVSAPLSPLGRVTPLGTFTFTRLQ